MECSSFGIGNIPNAGTYLERVSYESFENSFSNVRMINNSLTTINNIAGNLLFLTLFMAQLTYVR